jgi:hypothetical protein
MSLMVKAAIVEDEEMVMETPKNNNIILWAHH